MTTEFVNRTRRSRSIPVSLLTRGRLLDLPLYYVLRLSDLAREGLDHSGSWRFADHIYKGEPSGSGRLGRWLDGRLLNMPATRAFRFRYAAARDALAAFLIERANSAAIRETRVLSVPCGIPRELADAASEVRTRLGAVPGNVSFHGIDLDEDVIAEACRFMSHRGIDRFQAHRGDAFDPTTYKGSFDFITCTGLTEFLDDERTARLYTRLYESLEPGGWFVTSGMRRRWSSDYLLTLAELRTHYRDEDTLRRLLAPLRFTQVAARRDETGLQTVIVAAK